MVLGLGDGAGGEEIGGVGSGTGGGVRATPWTARNVLR